MRRYLFPLLLALLLAGCGRLSYGQVAKALRAEGITVQNNADMGKDFGSYVLDDVGRISVSEKRNAADAQKGERQIIESLQHPNAKPLVVDGTPFFLKTYAVGNLLISYTAPEKGAEALTAKVDRAIANLK